MEVNDVGVPRVSSDTVGSVSRKYTAGFRNNPWTYTFVALWLSLVMVWVHYSCILVDRTEIPLEEFEAAAVKFCGPSSISASFQSGGGGGGEGKAPLVTPPSIFSVAVWTNHRALLPSIHSALDSVRAALSTAGATVQRVVQLDESILPPTPENTIAGADMSGAQLDALQQEVVHQQLGINMLNHVAKKKLDDAAKPYAISFVVVQRNGNTFTGEEKTHCSEFAANQALCLLYVTALSAMNGDAATDSPLSSNQPMVSDAVVEALHAASVRNAIGTLLAKWWGLQSFKSGNDLKAWQEARQAQGCVYTLQAVRSLQSLLLAHPSMPIPEGVGPVVSDLHNAIQSHDFVRAARASERLQFHPLLIPQVFLPFDHVIVTHVLVMIPVLLSIVLTLKIWSLLRVHNKRVKKEQQQQQKQREAQAVASKEMENENESDN